MTERDNLPTKEAPRSLIAASKQRISLVTRGLMAIQSRVRVAESQTNDVVYLHARAAYDLITDGGGTRWCGERIGREWLPKSSLGDAFIVFQRLACESYGKAYFPLSTLYSGEQSVKGDRKLELHFSTAAFDWCFSNRRRNDSEIWNDLGCLYLQQGNMQEALFWFRKAADGLHPWGLFNLGVMYESGYGVEQDKDTSLYWQLKAAEQGNLTAILGLIRHYEFSGSAIADDEKALFWYQKAVEQGYPWTEEDFGADRFFELGVRYNNANNIEDHHKAIDYFLKAAELGHAEAQYELSCLLLFEKNRGAETQYWMMRSAELGFGPAQMIYARDYAETLTEEEASQLIESAGDWYRTHAEAGSSVWQYEYAILLLCDDDEWCGDSNEGMKWLAASAEQNYIPACYRLGVEYLRGEISEYTTQRGILWLSRAADSGNALACASLGDLYLGYKAQSHSASTGHFPSERVTPDHKAAVRWYELGISTGEPWAISFLAYKLGRLYLGGEQLEQNLQLAEKWLLLSATRTASPARKLLGDEYASGARLKQDSTSAIYWLTLAGENSKDARLTLAEIYLDGKLVARNFGEALKWLALDPEGRGRKNQEMKMVASKCFDGRFSAAEEVSAKAWLKQMASMAHERVTAGKHCYPKIDCLFLGELYELGLGFERDTNQAVFWYQRAAEQGNKSAQARLKELGLDWRTR